MWLVCRLGEIICLFTRYTTGPNILIRDVQTWTEKVKILDQLDLVEIMFSSIEKKNMKSSTPSGFLWLLQSLLHREDVDEEGMRE